MSKRLFHSQNINLYSYQWSNIGASGLLYPRDGSYGFSIGSDFFLVAGWEGGTATRKYVFKSTDNGLNWSAIADAPFTGRHTMATVNRSSEAIVIGGDVFNFGNDGVYAKGSYSFNGTSWTTLSSDCGIGTRSLMGCAELGGDIYLIGGQTSRYIADGSFNNVLKSTDNGVSFSSIATHPFPGGNLWGSLCAFNGKLWKVCGGIYDDASLSNRTHPVSMYSSPDGVTWTLEGFFPALGRQYPQLIVWDSKMWIINGVNTNTASPYNLSDVWYTSNGVSWAELTGSPYNARHAMTAWVANDSIYFFGGTTNPSSALTTEIWKLSKVLT